MGASYINLKGEFINHKIFGRGQIIEHRPDSVTVLFKKAEKKKFLYPAAIQTFLMLEDGETSKKFKEYSKALAFDNAAEQAAAAERLNLEKKAIQEHAKALKKAAKKPPTKKA